MAQRAYGGKTADERKAARMSALSEATLDILAVGGADAVTMRAVCATARLNDRYFYEHFRDSDELLVAVAGQIATEGTSRILLAIQNHTGDVRSTVRLAMRTGLSYLTEDPRRGHVLIESHATAPLRRWRNGLVSGLAATMTAQRDLLLGEANLPAIDAHLTALTLAGGFLELLTAWLQHQLDITQEHLIEFLTSMIITAAVPTAVNTT